MGDVRNWVDFAEQSISVLLVGNAVLALFVYLVPRRRKSARMVLLCTTLVYLFLAVVAGAWVYQWVPARMIGEVTGHWSGDNPLGGMHGRWLASAAGIEKTDPGKASAIRQQVHQEQWHYFFVEWLGVTLLGLAMAALGVLFLDLVHWLVPKIRKRQPSVAVTGSRR